MKVLLVVLVLALIAVGVLVAASATDIARYMRIRRM